MTLAVRHTMSSSPFDLDRLTGVRLQGDSGVTPIDQDSAELVDAGGVMWLRWNHYGVERAVNYAHIVEMFSDPAQLPVIPRPASR